MRDVEEGDLVLVREVAGLQHCQEGRDPADIGGALTHQ
jgi:hypothetical protein